MRISDWSSDVCSSDLLVDCLTLWLSNLMFAGRDVDAETARLVACLGGLSGRVVLVANEVGLGIVPENPLARRFRDHAGRLNQEVARAAQRVRSEEPPSELQSLMRISYAVLCLKQNHKHQTP